MIHVFYEEPEFHVKVSPLSLVFLVSEGGVLQPPLWSRILIKLSHLLLSLSSAANIVIYSAKVSQGQPRSAYIFAPSAGNMPGGASELGKIPYFFLKPFLTLEAYKIIVTAQRPNSLHPFWI